MIKDLYPVNRYPFEDLLLKNNYSLENNETWKYFIHNNYCIHISKKKELCRRKKVKGKDFCSKHCNKDEELINKCNYIKKTVTNV